MFVTFEGPEGAGKSTAIAQIAKALRAENRPVTLTREPGSGTVGIKIRALLLDPASPVDPRCELFLFLADRAQHVTTVIEPALARGEVVLCDRFGDSTVVYQGYGRGIDIGLLRDLNRVATAGRQPDLTLLLDVPPEVGLARIRKKDRLDSEPMAFHMKVREGFLTEAAGDPARWRVIDATQTPSAVAEEALREIRNLQRVAAAPRRTR